MDAHRCCDDGMADFLWTQSVDRWRGHDAFTDISSLRAVDVFRQF
jgi:hypothetical protein